MFDLSRAITIADLRAEALRRLPEFVMIPMETGVGDGSGPARNVEAFAQCMLRGRDLVDVSAIDQSVTVFGKTYSSPFGVTPIGGTAILRRGTDEFLAQAAAEANIPFVLSSAGSASIETIARIAPDHVWQQLYGTRDLAVSDHIIGRACDAGVEVLVYTADFPISAKNDWLARTGVSYAGAVRPGAWPYVAWQALTHIPWMLEYFRHGGLPPMEGWAPYAAPGAGARGIAKVFATQVPSVQTWAHVERVRKLWPGKLVVKGLVDPADAVRALEAGADAVTASNHGGNKLDCMGPALDVLPEIVSAVAGRAPVFFDSGIRRGADVLKTRALGASFSFVGRATLYGAIAGGQPGARRAIEILREDIVRTMALIGCPNVADMGPQFLHRRESLDLSTSATLGRRRALI